MLNFRLQKLAIFFTNIWFLWVLCLLFNIITFLVIYYKIRPGGEIVALRYNILVGPEWYGNGNNLYFIPGIALAISAVNFLIFIALKKITEFLPLLTVFTSAFVQVVLLFSVIYLSRVT